MMYSHTFPQAPARGGERVTPSVDGMGALAVQASAPAGNTQVPVINAQGPTATLRGSTVIKPGRPTTKYQKKLDSDGRPRIFQRQIWLGGSAPLSSVNYNKRNHRICVSVLRSGGICCLPPPMGCQRSQAGSTSRAVLLGADQLTSWRAWPHSPVPAGCAPLQR